MPQMSLTFMSGPNDGTSVVIDLRADQTEIIIGRSASATIPIQGDPEVSRRHAKLTVRGSECWLEDLGSTNGTFLGEFSAARRLAGAVQLVPGQLFKIGYTHIRVGSSDAWMDRRVSDVTVSAI